jgi:hypothetical protein
MTCRYERSRRSSSNLRCRNRSRIRILIAQAFIRTCKKIFPFIFLRACRWLTPRLAHFRRICSVSLVQRAWASRSCIPTSTMSSPLAGFFASWSSSCCICFWYVLRLSSRMRIASISWFTELLERPKIVISKKSA